MRSKLEHKKESRETQDLFALAFQATPHPHVILTLKEEEARPGNDVTLLKLDSPSRIKPT